MTTEQKDQSLERLNKMKTEYAKRFMDVADKKAHQ
jgi:hypothetical protein